MLDLITRSRDTNDVVGWVTKGVRGGVSPDDAFEILAAWHWHPWRRLVMDVLADTELGIESPLEWHYHHGVERAHGLPRADLQVRQKVGGRWIRADRRYTGFALRVELDGEIAHPGGRTDDDTMRDNDVVIDVAETTLRYRWGNVVAQQCRAAAQVARGLQRRGWVGSPRLCDPSCQLVRHLREAA